MNQIIGDLTANSEQQQYPRQNERDEKMALVASSPAVGESADLNTHKEPNDIFSPSLSVVTDQLPDNKSGRLASSEPRTTEPASGMDVDELDVEEEEEINGKDKASERESVLDRDLLAEAKNISDDTAMALDEEDAENFEDASAEAEEPNDEEEVEATSIVIEFPQPLEIAKSAITEAILKHLPNGEPTWFPAFDEDLETILKDYAEEVLTTAQDDGHDESPKPKPKAKNEKGKKKPPKEQRGAQRATRSTTARPTRSGKRRAEPEEKAKEEPQAKRRKKDPQAPPLQKASGRGKKASGSDPHSSPDELALPFMDGTDEDIAEAKPKKDRTSRKGLPLWLNPSVDYITSEFSNGTASTVGTKLMAALASWGNSWARKDGKLQGLPVTERPEIVRKWIKYGREKERNKSMKVPVVDPQELGAQLVKWWESLQPEFRKGKGKETLKRKSTNDKEQWAQLDYAGPNGLVLVVVVLWWWHRALEVAEIDPSEDDDWKFMAEDVTWVLKELAT